MKENPIDKDKVAENPGLLPYAHTVGSAVVKPTKEGHIKNNAMAAMNQQTNMQMQQIQKQMELLAMQAKALQSRIEISEKIYQAKMSFKPLIAHTYHLYEKYDDNLLLSMVAPTEWGKTMPYKSFIASVRLLADHTWEVVE